MKTFIKTMSLIMSVIMFLGVFSAANPAIAAEVQESQENTESAEKMAEDMLSGSINEIVEERDKFTKVYKTGQGTKKAVISSTPVHYEENGNWYEIDNSLVEVPETDFYTNSNNFFEVELPKELTGNSQIGIEKDGFSLTFELNGTDILDKKKKSKAKKVEPNTDNVSDNYNIADKTQSGLIFEDVGDNTSIEYCVTSAGIKENIILEKKPKQEVTYSYDITADNLSATLNDDKSVSFTSTQGDIVFKIPTPIMYDSNSASSQDIEVALMGESGKYVLEYKPSYEWLKTDAKYPVIIDPVIEVNDDNYGIIDTMVSSASPTVNSGSELSLYTGHTSEGIEYISYIDIVNNYYFNNGLAIKNALLYVYTGLVVSSGDSSEFEVAACPVVGNWTENSVTFNNKPSLDTNVILDIRTYTSESSGKYSVYDVTEAFASNSSDYNGIALITSATDDGVAVFCSSEDSNSENRRPYFVIEYYESQGVEEQFDYHLQSAGRAGKVYYNDYSNQIYIERDELGLSGLTMPVQIKRFYNSNAGGSISFYNLIFFGVAAYYGFGWKTNYNQSVEYAGIIDGKEYILYNNDQGQTVYFEKSDTVQDGKRKWVEVVDVFSTEKGYELWLSTSYESDLSANFGYATIKDSQNQTYEFNTQGLLTKINSGEDGSTASITVNYNANYSINKIVDGVGREYRFLYTEYESEDCSLLTSIQAYTASGNAIKLKDADNNNVDYKITYGYTFREINGSRVPILTSATYPDGESVTYDVTDNLTSVKNIDGYTLEYAFSGVGNCTITEKVYSENSIDPTLGGSLTVTQVNAYEKTFTDANNVSQTKQFDLYGRTISIINNDGTVVSRAFSDTMMSCGTLNESLYIDYETDYAVDGENIVINGGFDDGLSSWDISDSSKISRVTYTESESNTLSAMRFVGDTDSLLYAIQTIEVPDGVSGDGYHFSFLSKNFKNHNVDDLAYSSGIIVEAKTADGTWESVTRIYPNPFNDNWQKYSCEFNIDFEYDEIRLFVIHICQYGMAWFDDMSLINTYRPSESTSTDTETDSETTAMCSCSYCENNCECSHDGTTVCTPESCPDCGECTCEGCTQLDCSCRDCSDTCSKVSCNRGYEYSNTAEGSWFSMSDGEKEMNISQSVSGNYYGSQNDMNGVNTFYNYNQSNGQLNSVTNGNDYVTSYSYDAMNQLKSVTTSVSNLSCGNNMNTAYTYEDDRISNITHNGFSYNYEYDAWGNVISVKVGQQSLVNYEYGEGVNRNRINRLTYGNGDYTDYVYDNAGNVVTIKSYSSTGTLTADYKYTYDTNGMISVIENKLENTEIRYDENNITIVLLNAEGENDDITLYSTQLNNNEEKVENLGGISYTECASTYSGNVDKGTSVTNQEITSNTKNYNFVSETDYFGRQTKKEFSTVVSETTDSKQTLNIETSYGYKNLTGNRTTSLVSSYKPVLTKETETLSGETSEIQTQTLSDYEYLYTYDTNGNLTDISVNISDLGFNGVSVGSCVYDEAGQLVRENSLISEKSYVYVYDKGGNITQKIEYEYSADELGDPISTVNYTYDTEWKDKLTAYGDTAIVTDAIGNPLNMTSVDFLGNEVNATLEWNGRQLSAAIVDGTRYEYTYDSEGIRTKMAVYDVETDTLMTQYYYIWENGKLQGYTVINADGEIENTVKMLFDNTDDSVGYELYSADDNTTKTFFFLKDMNGNITTVYNENGEDVLQYAYDSWGNVNVILDRSSLEGINKSAEAAVYTPITYRGYMYDFYTGLYYLQSRYYNPLYCRFLNMDDTSILERSSGTVHGANLFAYCNNDPIQLIDPTGRMGSGAGTIEQERQDEWSSDGLWFFWALIVLSVIVYTVFIVMINIAIEVWSWLSELVTKVVSDVQHKLGIDVPETLEGQMERAKVKANERGRSNKINRHHIVARIDPRADKSRKILDYAKIGINSEENIATMNREAHWYIHTSLYHASVKSYLQNAKNTGVDDISRRTAVHTALATLKWELTYL